MIVEGIAFGCQTSRGEWQRIFADNFSSDVENGSTEIEYRPSSNFQGFDFVNDYRLVDFGDGRKLELIGGWLLDRPSPAALEAARRTPQAWNKACGRFEKLRQDQGRWDWNGRPNEPWLWREGSTVMRLEATPFGHLGFFPEHVASWNWLQHWVASTDRPLKILNLFAYTGGATIACARPGVEVVHVDSSKPSVQWARDNARMSGKEAATIRWIVDDVRVFCRREVNRDQAYQGIILDPPSYGHGPRGKLWSIDTDLDALLNDCNVLLERGTRDGTPGFLIFTSHSPQFDSLTTQRCLLQSMPWLADSRWNSQTNRNTLQDEAGRSLDFGIRSLWNFQPRASRS